MKLPNQEKAFVPKEKLTEHPSSETHVNGAPKAEFFRQYGFGPHNWAELARSPPNHWQNMISWRKGPRRSGPAM